MAVIPPTPIPPYYRTQNAPALQELLVAGTTDLTKPATVLKSTDTASDPFAVVLPDGRYPGQVHRFYIYGDNIGSSATFEVTSANIANGYTKFTLDDVGFTLVVEWDGSNWQMTGGNATPS